MNYGDLPGPDLGILTDPDMLLDNEQLHHLFAFGSLEPVLGRHPVVFLVMMVPFGAFNICRLQRKYIRIRRRTDC